MHAYSSDKKYVRRRRPALQTNIPRKDSSTSQATPRAGDSPRTALVCFPFPTSIIAMTNIPIEQQLATAAEEGTLADLIANRFGWLEDEALAAARAAAIDMHNTQKLDLLALIHEPQFKALAKNRFFFAQDFFNQIAPSLNAEPPTMISAIAALIEQAGEDGAANTPLGALTSWLKVDLARAESVIEMAETGDALAIRHLYHALVALADIERAHRAADQLTGDRRLAAISALGELTHSAAEASKTFTLFSRILDETAQDDSLTAALVLATVSIANKEDAPLADARALCASAVNHAGPHTTHFCARAIWRHKLAATDEELAQILLRPLSNVIPANKGTVRELDFALGALADNGREPEAIEFVTQMLRKPDCELELNEFPMFSGKLEKSAQLNPTVVAWLKSGAPALCEGLVKLLTDHHDGDRILSLGADDVAMSADEQIFVCRKAIGYFFIHPLIAASIVISFSRAPAEGVGDALAELLFMPLLLNYGGSVREYLETIESSDAAFNAATSALEKNKIYVEGMRDAGDIKELAPTEHQRMIEHMRRRDEAVQTFKMAREKSVLMQFVKRSTILYGRKSLSYIGDGKQRRAIEMDMAPHSYFMELPRMLTIDPIGLDYLMRLYRNEALPS